MSIILLNNTLSCFIDWFKEWAKHTGRYREGVDEPDWVTWKTRLRCALHKAADILEIKAESKTEIPESFKVYEFKPQKS